MVYHLEQQHTICNILYSESILCQAVYWFNVLNIENKYNLSVDIPIFKEYSYSSLESS